MLYTGDDYSNMGSDGVIISVMEEILGYKVRKRKYWQKYLCCCFYPSKKSTTETPILDGDYHDHNS